MRRVSVFVSVSGFSQPCRAHVQLYVYVRVHVEREPLRWVRRREHPANPECPHLQTVFADAESWSVLRSSMSGHSGVWKWIFSENLPLGFELRLSCWRGNQQHPGCAMRASALTGFLGWSREEWEAAWVEDGRLTGEKVNWLPSTLTDFPPPSLPISLPSLSLAQPSHQPLVCFSRHERGEKSPLLLLSFHPLLCLSTHHLLLF